MSAVSSYVDNLLKRVVTGRPAAEACARHFVHRLVAKAVSEKEKEGAAAREVAAWCAHEVVKEYLSKAMGEKEVVVKAPEKRDAERDVAAGCARVAVARWVDKVYGHRDQGAERKDAASAAKIAVRQWILKASEATSKAGERKVAAACARVAVARFMEKAEANLAQDQGSKERDFPEAVRRNETKAFERSVKEGDARQVAAVCARHAVKRYVDKAKETIRQGTEASAIAMVEQVHSAVVKAASKIASVAQPAIANLEGLVEDDESTSTGKSPMKPSGKAPEKRRPMPKETKAPKAKEWTAPPSPEQFEAEVLMAPKTNRPKVLAVDCEEDRKRDQELLQKRHRENLQQVRLAQEDLRSERSFHCVSVNNLPGAKAPRVPAKPKSGRKGRSSSRRSYVKQCSRRSNSECPKEDEKLLTEEEMRPDLDDPVLRAYLAVYKSTVCKRGDELDASTRGAGSCNEGLQNESYEKRRSKSATRHSSPKKDWLQPGLMAWQDKAKAWFWPRKGAMPPMESAVLALLNGNPPPIEAVKEAAAAARQPFSLPVLQKMQEAYDWTPERSGS